jgi:diguanylate cyclase (GGDEF)-like protein
VEASAAVAKEPAVDNSTSLKLADDLPELLNRTAFCQHVRTRVAEWKRGGPTLSLVLIDIDRFDSLTRAYGAKLRDLMVTSLARAIFAGVREMDTVARYSPSCFGFLLPKAHLPDAVRVADRIREAANQVVMKLNDATLGYSVSVGLIEVGRADDMVTLIRKAEIALDAGRSRGGNCVFYHDGDRPCLTAPAETVRA